MNGKVSKTLRKRAQQYFVENNIDGEKQNKILKTLKRRYQQTPKNIRNCRTIEIE
ncbi:MAG: hypothetical protein ACFE95_13440 [Candidatus Hodarchaeota archaeon]